MPSLPPDGFADGPPDGFADEPTPQPSVGQNAVSDVKDIVGGGINLPKQLLIDQPIQAGQDIYNTVKGMSEGQSFGQTPVANDLRTIPKMAEDVGKTAWQYARHPINSFKEHPVKMPLNVLGAAGAASDAFGAAKPILAPIGESAADVAEKASGLTYKTPGVLKDIYNEPKKLFAPGVDKARELYGQTEGEVTPSLSDISDHQKFVDKAMEMNQQGTLNPLDALEARKSLDKIRKNVTGSYYRKTRNVLDAIAKQDYAIADKVYSQGVKSDNARSLFGLNKGGTPSLVKMGVGTLMKGAIPAFSPLFQSSVAAGFGAADKAAGAISRSAVGPVSSALSNPPVNRGDQFNDPAQNDQQDNPGNHPSNQGRVLDEAMARQFLAKAKQMVGGAVHKAKALARKMAEEAGYIVQ